MTVQIPILNAPNLYVNGLHTQTNSLSTINIFNGAARDSTNQNDIVLSNNQNVSFLINGAGGLDTGTILPDTFYAIHLIGDSTGYNPGIGLLSLSAINPLLPKGYDMFRRISWTITNNEGQVTQSFSIGDGTNRVHYFTGPIFVYTADTNGYKLVDLALGIPNLQIENSSLEGIFQVTFTSAAATDTLGFTVFNDASPILEYSNGFVGTSINNYVIPTAPRNGNPSFFCGLGGSTPSVSISSIGFRDFIS